MGCGFSKNDVVNIVTTGLTAVVTGHEHQQQGHGQQHQQQQQHGQQGQQQGQHQQNQQQSHGHQQQNQQQHHGAVQVGNSTVSPYYTSLPQGATKVSVRNVYDGDTLTLSDERRIRFLGIDTPEIKEKQPYAVDAKNYTKSHIDSAHNEIYIVQEPNQEATDHYGRLLVWVYVKCQDNQGYLCINEGLVCSGYASVYIVNQSTKFHSSTKMFAQQKIARQSKLGIWKQFNSTQIVYTTRNGTAYHSKNCKHLNNSKNTIQMSSSDALDKGLHPCRTCQT